jgi:hypothetical protein
MPYRTLTKPIVKKRTILDWFRSFFKNEEMKQKICPHIWQPVATHFDTFSYEQDCLCKICGKWKTINRSLVEDKEKAIKDLENLKETLNTKSRSLVMTGSGKKKD